jgi:superfamily II DNA/RNA helicase
MSNKKIENNDYIYTRPQSKRIILSSLSVGAKNGIVFDERPYQITIAHKCHTALASGENVIMTLPTGTGKTLISGMVTCLHLHKNPEDIVLVTAPRQVLLKQISNETRWLSGTFPTTSLGIPPNDRPQDIIPVFSRAKVIFAMPEFLSGRIKRKFIPTDLLSKVSLLIVDEFDAFLTFRYRINDVVADLHQSISKLLEGLPNNCQVMMMSATTPPKTPPSAKNLNRDLGSRRDLATAEAFRSYLDKTFKPKHITIAERYYADHIPHAEIARVEIYDPVVINYNRAITEEIGLLLNWASGMVKVELSANYILPRLPQIINGKFPLWPRGLKISKRGSDNLKGILSRLLLISHCGDFLFEDMFKDFDTELVETFVWNESYTRKFRTEKLRLILPDRVKKKVAGRDIEKIEIHPYLQRKAIIVQHIVDLMNGSNGVVFYRYVRLLNAFKEKFEKMGISFSFVHGGRKSIENKKAISDFKKGNRQLLLITRDTGKRGLDIPEADYAIFYSPKSRADVTWQEVSRIRSTTRIKKNTFILNYSESSESQKADRMFSVFQQQPRSIFVKKYIIEQGDVPNTFPM